MSPKLEPLTCVRDVAALLRQRQVLLGGLRRDRARREAHEFGEVAAVDRQRLDLLLGPHGTEGGGFGLQHRGHLLHEDALRHRAEFQVEIEGRMLADAQRQFLGGGPEARLGDLDAVAAGRQRRGDVESIVVGGQFDLVTRARILDGDSGGRHARAVLVVDDTGDHARIHLSPKRHACR